MTAFLVIAGIPISCAEAAMPVKKEATKGGTKSRAYLGNMQVTFRWQARAWTVTTIALSDADCVAIETATALGVAVVCSGTALVGSSGATLVCIVTCTDGPAYTPVDGGTGLGFMRALSLLIEEASP